MNEDKHNSKAGTDILPIGAKKSWAMEPLLLHASQQTYSNVACQ
jgi:hypothetical protein